MRLSSSDQLQPHPLLLLITLHRNPNHHAFLTSSDLSRCSGGDIVYYRPGVWGGSEAVMCPLDRTPLLGATVVGSLPATSHHGTHTPTATVRHGVMESFYWLIAASHQQTELWQTITTHTLQPRWNQSAESFMASSYPTFYSPHDS